MSFLIGSNYNINFYQYDEIEESFLKHINLLSNKFPFKWEIFINDIISEKSLCYFKDTSMIVNLYLLKKEKVEVLFTFLKSLLSTKGIKKIIYRKEFIIVHFHSYKVTEVFKNHQLWQIIAYYFTIKNNYKEYNAKLGALVKNNKNEIEKIDLIFEKDNKYYIFNSNEKLKIELDQNYHQYFVYLFNNDYVSKLKIPKICYSFNEFSRINTINEIVKNEIFS